jgi:hypothetical protein
MTRDEVAAIVEAALTRLVRYDYQLLDLKVCERALQFRIAHYMAQSRLIRRPLTLDCEYNRHWDEEKLLWLFGNPRASKVFPDILIHERNTDANNMVALEIKRPDQSLHRDREKLRAFRNQLMYPHVGHIIIGHNRQGQLVREVRWVDG